MKSKAPHDGEVVRMRLQKQGMTKAEFARRMDLPERSVYRLLDQAHWTAKDLEKAGQILETNFLKAYWPAVNHPEPPLNERKK